jgi:hypothetical protein
MSCPSRLVTNLFYLEFTIRSCAFMWDLTQDSALLYILNTRNRVLLDKLIVPQLVKKLPAFYGHRRFTAVLTTARHLSLTRVFRHHKKEPSIYVTVPLQTEQLCILGRDVNRFSSGPQSIVADDQGHNTSQHSCMLSSPGQNKNFPWPWPPISPTTVCAQERRYAPLRSIYKMQHVKWPSDWINRRQRGRMLLLPCLHRPSQNCFVSPFDSVRNLIP